MQIVQVNNFNFKKAQQLLQEANSTLEEYVIINSTLAVTIIILVPY